MFERLIEKAASALRKPDPQLPTRSALLSLTEWPESEAHLAFVAHFLEGRSADSYLDNWVRALDEAPREVIARFIRQGLLEPLPLIDNVAGCNTVAELKKLLKERALKVTGKKRDLAERLVLNDEADMERLHRDKAIVTCSATHSPMFFGPRATETFVKLRKSSDLAIAPKPFTLVQPVDLCDMSAKDQFQIICFENNNAAFFADTVVLIEGDSDYLLMPHIARTLDESWDVAHVPIVFARMTGKGNIRRYRGFFTRFGIRVPVIADLDLLVSGFDHIAPDEAMRTARNNLLVKVDELVAPNAAGPSAKDSKDALDSGELRGLWRRVRERQTELKSATCTQDEHDQAVEAFFAWQRKSDRLAILTTSKDAQLLELKWRLLALLRAIDVYVLERGAIEQYYPDTIRGPDKPSRAQDFCRKVTTRDSILACCGEQQFESRHTREPEGVQLNIWGHLWALARKPPNLEGDMTLWTGVTDLRLMQHATEGYKREVHPRSRSSH